MIRILFGLLLLAALGPVGGGAPVIYDIPYGDYHPSLKLDLYPPYVSTGSDPVLVYLHGGLPPSGNKSSIASHYAPILELLRLNGIAVAAVEFTPYPTYSFPDQLHDVQLAMQFLRSKAATYGLDPERIGVWGVSSGALLAGWLCFTENGADPGGTPMQQLSTRPLLYVGWDGITDFTLLIPNFTGVFFGTTFLNQVDPQLQQEASITWEICNIPREYTPPVYTLYSNTPDEPPLDNEHDAYFGYVFEKAMRSCAPAANALSHYEYRDEPLNQITRGMIEWIMVRFGMDGPMVSVQKQ
jgi:alpha/beta hydrolase fold